MLLRSSRQSPLDAHGHSEQIPTPNEDPSKPPLDSQETLTSYASADTDSQTDSQTVLRRRPRPKSILVVAGILVLAVILGVHLGQIAVAKNKEEAVGKETAPPMRVRRSWKAYTEAEKQHYLSAVQIAMERGYHYRFVQIHTAHISRITSHGACPFLLWHRRFILGYENMLRSLAPEYANLTLPYWNYFEDTNRQLATDVLCDSLESCSQFLRDMGGGGLTDGPTGESMTIEHLNIESGTCVSKGIAGHACNHPNGTASGLCRNCIMRGQWNNPRKIVEALGPDLLRVLDVFNATGEDETEEGAHALVSHEIERTFHNAIHNTLNSTMRATSSAFDPIFIGHHGMVDLAQLVFNRCKYVANASVVIDWKKEQRDTRFDVFKACDVEDDEAYNYTAFGNETMHMTFRGVPVKEDPFTSQFFGGYGDKYVDIASAEDLGAENSYTYAIDPYLQELLERHNVRCPPYLYENNNMSQGRRLRESQAETKDAHDRQRALGLVDTLASCGEAIADRHPTMSYKERVDQEGLVKCLVVEKKSGGELADYDDEFRSMMNIPATDSPYCVKLLRRYRSGELHLLADEHCLQAYGAQTGVDLITTTI